MVFRCLGCSLGASDVLWMLLVFFGCFYCSLGASIVVQMLLLLQLWFLVSHARFF